MQQVGQQTEHENGPQQAHWRCRGWVGRCSAVAGICQLQKDPECPSFMVVGAARHEGRQRVWIVHNDGEHLQEQEDNCGDVKEAIEQLAFDGSASVGVIWHGQEQHN